MNKALKITLVVAILTIAVFAHASFTESIYKSFGGHLTNKKATKLETKEKTYNCVVPGKTFEASTQRKSDPTGYFIPTNVRNQTGYELMAKQGFLGIFSNTQTTINCTLKEYPFSSSTIELPTIQYYGTSKQ